MPFTARQVTRSQEAQGATFTAWPRAVSPHATAKGSAPRCLPVCAFFCAQWPRTAAALFPSDLMGEATAGVRFCCHARRDNKTGQDSPGALLPHQVHSGQRGCALSRRALLAVRCAAPLLSTASVPAPDQGLWQWLVIAIRGWLSSLRCPLQLEPFTTRGSSTRTF